MSSTFEIKENDSLDIKLPKVVRHKKWLVLALVMGISCLAQQLPQNRYFYALDCGGDIKKLDVKTGEFLGSVDLSKRTKFVPAVPSGQSFDGCLTHGALYIPDKQLFYTIAQTTHLSEGLQQHYRLLAFSVPDLQLKASFPIPKTISIDNDDLPRVFRNAEGAIQVLVKGQVYEISGTRLQFIRSAQKPSIEPALITLPTQSNSLDELDLTHYTDSNLGEEYKDPYNRKAVPFERIQSSNDAVLIELTGPNGPGYAVVHTLEKKICLLQGLPATGKKNLHMTPDGSAILIEESHGEHKNQKTGKVVLIDTETSKTLGHWEFPAIRQMSFDAFTPDGNVIYGDGSKLSAFPMGKPYSHITRISDSFFANN